MDKIIIQGLKAKCIIGDYEWERKRPQKIILDLELETDLSAACERDELGPDTLDYSRLAKDVLDFIGQSSFHLIETLAEKIASFCLKKFPIDSVTIRLTKPAAIKAADYAQVEIYRERN